MLEFGNTQTEPGSEIRMLKSAHSTGHFFAQKMDAMDHRQEPSSWTHFCCQRWRIFLPSFRRKEIDSAQRLSHPITILNIPPVGPKNDEIQY